ncbi:MAG: TRAP transporter large permease subunit [Betaproteobacteria bacterium]|nr:TRAP transporter large permease subunit [Betaproteobacteria bacterium]
MFDAIDLTILVIVLLGAVFSGVHIAVALGATSVLGIYLMTDDIQVARQFVGNTAYEALRDYVFAVIPLFMLMGEFLSKCGAARDVYALVSRLTKIIPARLAVATVIANAIFAFVTGVSIAAAAAFSRIAHPEMKRAGYTRQFSLGCIAGSSCLGMLIPPSVLMIVWGVLTEQSIGKLFLAGVLPGFLLVVYYIAYIQFVAFTNPAVVGEIVHADRRRGMSHDDGNAGDAGIVAALWSTLLVVALVIGVLGGIWLGAFTPTEGAGVGAAAALVLSLIKRLRANEVIEVIVSVGRTSGPLLLLLFTAQLYSRVLSMTGITKAVQDLVLGFGLPPLAVLALMVLVWFILGCIIDSISIILLTVPVFAPIAQAAGFDPLAFAILGIIAIETGLLTPPFGILVFTVQAALPEEKGATAEIFRGAIPYWIALFAAIATIAIFPQVATWLPTIAFSGN